MKIRCPHAQALIHTEQKRRPQTDNDFRVWKSHHVSGFWQAFSEMQAQVNVVVDQSNEKYLKVEIKRSYNDSLLVTTSYRVDQRAQVEVNFKIEMHESMPMPLRIGSELKVSDKLQDMKFFGKGPWENYIDRSFAADVNEYSGTVNDFVHNYVTPQ